MKHLRKANKKRKAEILDMSSIRGPKPEVLKIEGNWKDLIKKSLERKKPKDGWPK